MRVCSVVRAGTVLPRPRRTTATGTLCRAKAASQAVCTGQRRPLGVSRRIDESPHLGTRQCARILNGWGHERRLNPADYRAHSMDRTKATLTCQHTKNLRAIQLLPGACGTAWPRRGDGAAIDQPTLTYERPSAAPHHNAAHPPETGHEIAIQRFRPFTAFARAFKTSGSSPTTPSRPRARSLRRCNAGDESDANKWRSRGLPYAVRQ